MGTAKRSLAAAAEPLIGVLFTVLYERLNGVNRQPPNDQKFNRQLSKKGKFYRQPSKRAVVIGRQMVSEGLSNFRVSAAHLGLRALKESYNWYN